MAPCAAAPCAHALRRHYRALPPPQDEDFQRAAELAFEMRHPGRLLAVVRQAQDAGREEGARIMRRLAAAMSADDLRQCLEYCRCARGRKGLCLR